MAGGEGLRGVGLQIQSHRQEPVFSPAGPGVRPDEQVPKDQSHQEEGDHVGNAVHAVPVALDRPDVILVRLNHAVAEVV
eukprot:CAMPEP_0175498182 /NCGR_PEP_ID=MMETSP0096-20121207/5186_1 /TAXON_ID=311494 /ORGANISM="Alexandrium monilatum, Strain CCMP3105" /LENGTH=78 /DNA_ID=CAMNT_0016800209 /DNA_START=96 /DNA_END=331 /DNA_ORIENTATION=-